MAELFVTWKQPSANGSSLFEKEPMKKIEKFLEQARKQQSDNPQINRPVDFQTQSRQFLGNREALSQAGLLIQVDKLLVLTKQRNVIDHNDTDAVKQIDILNQLKVILGSQKLPESILPGIQQTLVGITDKEMDRLNQKEAQQQPQHLVQQSQHQQQQQQHQPHQPQHQQHQQYQQQHQQQHQQQQHYQQKQQYQQQHQQQQQQIPRDPRFLTGVSQLPQSFVPSKPPALSYQNYSRSSQASFQPSQYSTSMQHPPSSSFFTSEQMQQVANIMTNMNVGQQPSNYGNNNNNSNNHNDYDHTKSFNNFNSNGNGAQFNHVDMFQAGNNNSNYQAPAPIPYSIPSDSSVQKEMSTQNPLLSSSLINSLMSAGLLPKDKKSTAVNPIFEDIQLNSISLNKPRSNLIRLLYEDMPKSCSTCGKRFPDTPEGLKTRDAHMDWHFRVNKKLREENWTQMRCWYLTKSEWVKYRDEEEILSLYNADDEYHSDSEYAPVLGEVGQSGNGTSGAKKSSKLDYEALQKKYVLVPGDKHLASLPCPICKEKFISVWNDDVEDWVWTNAVEVKNRIFHATCHEESDSDLIKRILGQQEVGIASIRNITPLPEALVTGVKRKMEDNEDGTNIEVVTKKEKKS